MASRRRRFGLEPPIGTVSVELIGYRAKQCRGTHETAHMGPSPKLMAARPELLQCPILGTFSQIFYEGNDSAALASLCLPQCRLERVECLQWRTVCPLAIPYRDAPSEDRHLLPLESGSHLRTKTIDLA